MERCQVHFTANAGVFVTAGRITVAIDAFPAEESRGFSALSASDFQKICRWEGASDTRYVIATHDHPDHYCPDWNGAFLAGHPGARFIGPVSADRLPKTGEPFKESPILLRADRPVYYLPSVTLEFARLTHEGEAFSSVPNYGCLMTFSPEAGDRDQVPCRVLVLGDAKPADPVISDWTAGRAIDLALLNFPWIALPKGRRFLDEHLSVRRIGVIHLPYEGSDGNHYLEVTRRAAAAYRPGDTVLFTRFGQEASFFRSDIY